MAEGIKEKTVSSMIWSALQRFGVLGLSFVSNLVLARYLTVEDYGAIGMLTVFISLSETIIDSGFGAALIQKKNPDELDYSTVFWTNLFISVFLYFILYITAPQISNFYKMEILTPILRVKAISLIIQGFRLIQTTRLQKTLNFKRISIVYLIASFVSTVVSIICAIFGMGVWSLVVKTLLDTFIRTIIFWVIGNWHPLFRFSTKSFKELFSYGGVMLSTSIIITLYSNVQSLIIGKAFSAGDLGYYTQASKLESLPTNAFEQIVNQVTFPIFSQFKENVEKMKRGLKKILVSVSYVTFPMMTYMIVAATPIFNFLYGQKWEASVPYFKYLCLVGMMVSVNTMNTNLIKATGKKGLYFKLQLVKRIIGIILILGSVVFGMTGLLLVRVIIEYCFFAINTSVTMKAIHYSIFEQIKDLLPNYLLSFATAGFVYFIFRTIHLSHFLMIITQLIVYSTFYIGISALLRFKGFSIYKEIFMERIKKWKSK